MEADHDYLDEAVDQALQHTMEERFLQYCAVVAANFAMQGIDVTTHPVERVIYYIDATPEA